MKVRIFWAAAIGSPAPIAQHSIRLYAGGPSLPSNATPQFSVASPTLTHGFMNEFDVASIAGNKTIASGPFTVTLRFSNGNAGQFTKASVVSAQPCQSGKNVIRFTNGTWHDACSQGVSGNWIFEVTYRIANCEMLNRDVAEVSLSSGGLQHMTLAGGPAEAGKFYWMFGSVTGTSPGIPIPNGVLPLNFDLYTQMTLGDPFNPLFVDFFGVLDPTEGFAFAGFSVPVGSDAEFTGVTLHHAYITIPTPGIIDSASNAVALLLVP
jgi:hypothetical protein